MRIISGKYKGRKLKAVSGTKTRPTTDKVKESMFNIIGDFNGGKVLDLFSGSGSLAIEAVSRGALEATLVDKQYQAVKTINENIKLTNQAEKFEIFKDDAKRVLKKLAERHKKYDFVFLDPPYKKQEIESYMLEFLELKLLEKNALIICETDLFANLSENIAGYVFEKKVTYGITQLTFYSYLGGD